MVVGLEFLPVMTAPVLRSVTKDPKRLHSLADVVFEHWDTLKMGRLAKSDVMKGFKEVCQSYNVPILDDEQAEAMCLSACMFMNADADATGEPMVCHCHAVLCHRYATGLPMLDDERAETMCLSACMFMIAEADASGEPLACQCSGVQRAVLCHV